MKTIYILMIMLFLVTGACQRSQFSTTARHVENGRVTYVNKHRIEKSRSHNCNFRKEHVKQEEAPAGRTNAPSLPIPDNLIASTAAEPTIIAVSEHRFVTENEPIMTDNVRYQLANEGFHEDSVKYIAPKKGTTADFSAQYVISLKDGHKITSGIIYQLEDTLFYQLSSNPKVTRTVGADQVDTIIRVRYFDPDKAQVVDTRKTEKLAVAGLVFSILGIFPLVGLPFAVLGLIFGAISLRRINRNPEKYRGKGKAQASLFIGIVMTAISAAILIALAISGGPNVSLGM